MMTGMSGRAESAANTIWRLLVRLTIIGLALFAFFHLRNIVVTLLIGAIIAYMMEPMVEWLTRRPVFVRLHTLPDRLRNLPPPTGRHLRHKMRLFATIYVFILSVIVLWQGTLLVIVPFRDQYENFQQNKDVYIDRYNQKAPKWATLPELRKIFDKEENKKKIQETSLQAAGKVASMLKNVVEIVLLPVLAFYFILDGPTLKREFVVLTPRRHLRETLRMLREFNLIMRSFVLGQFILCALAGVVVGIGLALLKVQYAFVLGVLAGITRAIPIVGPIIGGIPIILLTYLDGGDQGMQKALAVLAFFTFLHFAESKFIMPMLIGERMELHPVVIIIVLLIGGEIGGILLGGTLGSLLGMFFAAPVAAILRVMIRRYKLRLRPHVPHVDHGGGMVHPGAPIPLPNTMD